MSGDVPSVTVPAAVPGSLLLGTAYTQDVGEPNVTEDSAEQGRYYKVAEYWIDHAVREKMGGLDLTNHELTFLPPGIGNAADLTTLTPDRNQLKSIPAEIGDLKRLRYLSVLDNPLNDIPREIGRLSDSTVIRLDPTLLPSTMAAAYRAGIPSFLAYLRSLAEAKPHYEAKVVLIGDGNAGKTTCLERLITGGFVERPTTHGIEVRNLDIPHPDVRVKDPIRLNYWDFGGQDIYRVTHQFFYSRDAIY
jgi:internalin A